jgi:hypothetical protein
MNEEIDYSVLKRIARTAGWLTLALAVLGPIGLMILPSQLIAPGDAMATLVRIRASGGLFRLWVLADLAIIVVELFLSLVLYRLFKPTDQSLSLTALAFRLTNAIIQAANLMYLFFVLSLLGGAGVPAGPDAGILATQVTLVLDANARVVFLWQAFFGIHLLLVAILIYRSHYVPRIVGIFVAIASLGYLSDCLGNFLNDGYKAHWGWIVGVTAAVGELVFMFWLLIWGVKVPAGTDSTGVASKKAIE